MTQVTIKDGSEDARRKISALRDTALVEGAVILEGECIVRCPVDTGHLKGSISRKVHLGDGSIQGETMPDGIDGVPKAGDAVVGTNVSYAPHVEYGTKYQKAQPFMRSGAVAAVPKIKDLFHKRLGQPVTVSRYKEETHAV